MQKGVFYEPLCNLLIPWRLQSRFFAITLRFVINMPLLFVRLFLNSPSCAIHVPTDGSSLRFLQSSLPPLHTLFSRPPR